MTNVHQFFAPLLAVGGLVLLVVLGVATATRRPARFATDRVILGVEAVVLLGVATGGVILLTGGRPADPLHLLYAAVAMAVLPVARFWSRLARHRAIALTVAALLLAGLALRLFQTG